MKKQFIFFVLVMMLIQISCNAQGKRNNYREIVEQGNISHLDSLLSADYLKDFSKDELRIIRNTIFAKHGYIFESNDLKNHFESFDWYKGTSNNINELLTEIDKSNIRTIQQLESNNADDVGNDTQDGLIYIQISNYTAQTVITVKSIDEYRKLIEQYKTQIILFNANTFFFENNAMLYSIASNGYKTIYEYEAGFARGFKDGASYYFAQENRLTTQDEVDHYKTENYLSADDFFDAKAMGMIKNNVENKISRVIGLIRKTDLQNSLRYANVVILINSGRELRADMINNTEIETTIQMSNGTIRPFGDSMYYISMPVNYSRWNTQGVGNNALFYYALKLAQYKNIAEYKSITSTNVFRGIMNSNETVHYNIKNNELLTTGLGYKSYNDFEDSMNRNIYNSSDYYVVKKYY